MKDIKRQEHILDATDISLGRLASKIAVLLMGKNKPTYVPYLDEGDTTVIENIKYIKITGNKKNNKIYYSHSQHPGGLKAVKLKDFIDKKGLPEVLRKAVYGMLPSNKLRNGRMKRLIIK